MKRTFFKMYASIGAICSSAFGKITYDSSRLNEEGGAIAQMKRFNNGEQITLTANKI